MIGEPHRTLGPGIAPPQRIELGELLLRRWRAEDLLPRFEAVRASYEHIHPWMDWLAQPPTLDRQRAFDATAWPSAEGGYNYGIFATSGDTTAVLGAIGLHDRLGDRAMEIGYWCHVDHTGRGVVTRSAAALTAVALALPGVDRVEIRCDAANVRSAAVPRRLGYRLDRLVPREIRAPAESGEGMVWVKLRM
jgi:RimJ/RimL family protein N-acetyltransferase